MNCHFLLNYILSIHTSWGTVISLHGATPSRCLQLHLSEGAVRLSHIQSGISDAGIRHPHNIIMSWLDLAPACLKSWALSRQGSFGCWQAVYLLKNCG